MYIGNIDVSYLCVVIVMLIASYKFLDYVRESQTPKFSTELIITDHVKRVSKNVKILRNILSASDRKLLSKYIQDIEDVIKNPSYFSKPCITILNADDETLRIDELEIKRLPNQLRKLQINKYAAAIIDEVASDYEALINLSRNSFCKEI